MAFTAGNTDIRNYEPAFKAGAQLPGANLTWGTQTIVLSVHSTSTASASANTQIAITPSGGAPVAATVKFVQVMPTNDNAAVWELASTTNTKAFVIARANNGAGSSLAVVGATSILNVGIAAGEVVLINSPTAGGSATIVVGIETAN